MNLEDQEQQLYYLQRQKIQQLEKQLQIKVQDNNDLRNDYEALFNIYEHNRKVIEDREQELDQVTKMLLELNRLSETRLQEQLRIQGVLNQKENEFETQKSILKGKNQDLGQQVRQLKRSHEEEVLQYQGKLKQVTQQLELLKHDKQFFKNQANELELARDQISKLQEKNTELLKVKSTVDQLTDKNAEYQEEITQFAQKTHLLKQQHSNEIINYQNDIALLKQKIQQQQQIIDQFKRDLEDHKGSESANLHHIQGRVLQLQQEKQELEYKFLEMKQNKKNKCKQLKENGKRLLSQYQKESEDKLKKLEFEVKQLSIENEKLSIQESNYKEKLMEVESKLSKLQLDSELRTQQMAKNNEQDKKQQKNELEHKQFQITKLQEEITQLKQTISESNKLLDNMAAKIQELRSENNVLVEEVVNLRKESKQQVKVSGKKQQQPVQQVQQHKPKQFLDEEEEVVSVEKLLFSGDEGPVSSLMYKGSLNKQSKRNHSKNLEQENTELKQFVRDMHQTMENTKDQLLLKVQELNINKQELYQAKERIQQLQSEIIKYKEQILSLENQLKNAEHNVEASYVQKLQNSKDIILKLREEREKLLEITNELNQRLRDQDNSDELLHMQTEIKYLQNQLKQIKEAPTNQKPQLPNLSEIQNQLYMK